MPINNQKIEINLAAANRFRIYMVVITKTFRINSGGEDDMIDITQQVATLILEDHIRNGIVTIFVPGSTAAVTTIEYEPGLKHDFPKMLTRIAPKDIEYEHDNTWHDGNGHSHVRASIVGPSLTIPFSNGSLLLGTWQQIVLIEMDTRPRSRSLVAQIMGE
jgi:secondary thiamine-phosphate synthase enzyme